MMLDVALVLAWLAAIYRLGMLLRHPATVWRISFTASMVAVAVALTLRRFRLEVDQALGAWNISGLLNHLVLLAGLACMLVYLDALRMPVVPARRIRAYLVVTAASMVLITAAWAAAPIHDQPREDLLPLAGHPAVIVYCLAFWVAIAVAVFVLGWTCLAQGRAFRRADPARSVSLVLIGVAGFAAVPVVALWVVALLLWRRSVEVAILADTAADALMPWPLVLDALGVLSLLVVPYLSALISAWWRWWCLRPLWRELIRRHPEVHLQLKPSGGPKSRAEMRTERVLIEIRDALRSTRVDVAADPAGCPLAAVAAALHRDDRGGARRAADLLPRADDRDDDIRQVLSLARAYRAAESTA